MQIVDNQSARFGQMLRSEYLLTLGDESYNQTDPDFPDTASSRTEYRCQKKRLSQLA